MLQKQLDQSHHTVAAEAEVLAETGRVLGDEAELEHPLVLEPLRLLDQAAE